MSDFATAAGHWYKSDGTPAYTMIGANGKERAVTLRDARKENLFPGVTTIIRCAAAPALEKWKRDQVLLSAMTLPRIDGEPSDDFVRRVEQDWQQQGRAAADRGTAIHAAIERHFRGEQPDEEFWPWVKAARDEIARVCGPQEWSAERSFACARGYGGKTDLHSTAWVIDSKTKDGPADGRKLWDEELMQLAAYRHGLGLPAARCGILHVDRTNPSATIIEATPEQLATGLEMFSALLSFWQAKTGHRP